MWKSSESGLSCTPWKAYLQGGALTVIRELGFKRLLPFHRRWVTYCAELFMETMWCMLKICLFPPGSGAMVCAGQRVFMCRVSNKNAGHWVSNDCTWETTFHMCCRYLQLEKPGTRPVWLTWRLMPGLLWTLPLEPFLILCPLVLMNHSHEHDYVLSPVSLTSKSPVLGVVLGTLDMKVDVTDCGVLPHLLGLSCSICWMCCLTYLKSPNSKFWIPKCMWTMILDTKIV